jgi:hypothetical protein
MEGRVGVANAAGVATCFYGPTPEGYVWYVERLSSHAPTQATTLQVFASPDSTNTDPGYRADFSGAAADAISDETNPIYVPAGYYLVFRWAAATAGDVCVAAVQIAVHQLNPQYLMSPEDRVAVREAHERLAEHQVAEVATAGRRAV